MPHPPATTTSRSKTWPATTWPPSPKPRPTTPPWSPCPRCRWPASACSVCCWSSSADGGRAAESCRPEGGALEVAAGGSFGGEPRPESSGRGADSRAAPCGASVPAAGGAAVVLERLSDRGAGVRPPARAHPTRRANASPRRRSCRPSFAVAFEHRLAHRAQGKACVPLQPVQMPFEARDRRQVHRGPPRVSAPPPPAWSTASPRTGGRRPLPQTTPGSRAAGAPWGPEPDAGRPCRGFGATPG